MSNHVQFVSSKQYVPLLLRQHVALLPNQCVTHLPTYAHAPHTSIQHEPPLTRCHMFHKQHVPPKNVQSHYSIKYSSIDFEKRRYSIFKHCPSSGTEPRSSVPYGTDHKSNILHGTQLSSFYYINWI